MRHAFDQFILLLWSLEVLRISQEGILMISIQEKAAGSCYSLSLAKLRVRDPDRKETILVVANRESRGY